VERKGLPSNLQSDYHRIWKKKGHGRKGAGLAFILFIRYPATMSRPLRLEFPDAIYHITSRGDRREDIYEDDDDRSDFLDVFTPVIVNLTGCVMPIV
jgi:hypothetical protein